MNTIRTSSFWGTMAAVFALSTGALAATPAAEEHDAHHPDQEQAEAVSPDASGATMPMRMQAMQERMKMMREARDPQERMRMMEEQMADLDTATKGMADCPMMSGDMPMERMGMGMGPMGGEGMMRQQGGMGMGGMGGMGMMQRQGEPMHSGGMMRHHPEMMQQHGEMLGKRLDSMEKRLDLMQSIVESHMARRGRMTQ
ncbi:MAG TPA: hypothetical protein PK725_17545 [Rhodocyclaceae bacterium]|nr:hypothetical protein [Rhodocyclaceae bacterium]